MAGYYMNNKFNAFPLDYIYKFIKFIINIPISFVRYFCLGFFFIFFNTIDIVITPIYNVIFYSLIGFITLCMYCYRLLYYFIKGIKTPYILIYNAIIKSNIRQEKRLKEINERKERERAEREQAAARQKIEIAERLAREQEALRKKREAEENEHKLLHKHDNESYINENVDYKKKTFGEKINDFIVATINYPKRLIEIIKDKFHNSVLARNARNNKTLHRESLLIDFEGKDAEKTESKLLYEYTGKNAEGKFVKGYFEAFSKVEVHSFLLSEGMEVYSIRTNKWIRLLHQHEGTVNVKIKNKDLVFFLTQLSTYIKSGIPLVEALKILTKQYKNKAYQRIFRAMIYDLTMGESFSSAMEKQNKAFPRLLINMIKTSEMTGQLPEVLDDQVEYYTEVEKTRKAMVSALTYPIMILIIAVAVVIFIMVWVVPQFVTIFESMDGSTIPGITLFILGVSNFLQKYWYLLIIFAILIAFLCWYLYKNVDVIRIFTQWLLMHLPVIGNVIIYNETTLFTKTFAALLEHNVFITDSMEILNKITNNEIYKMLIKDTIVNLARGEKISTAFEGNWAFPLPAYEMLVTGEKTGELPQMMKRVSEYYQDLHRNEVARIKTFIEPILIIVLTVLVGIIVLSIIVPMFELYNQLQSTTR